MEERHKTGKIERIVGSDRNRLPRAIFANEYRIFYDTGEIGSTGNIRWLEGLLKNNTNGLSPSSKVLGDLEYYSQVINERKSEYLKNMRYHSTGNGHAKV